MRSKEFEGESDTVPRGVAGAVEGAAAAGAGPLKEVSSAQPMHPGGHWRPGPRPLEASANQRLQAQDLRERQGKPVM